MLEDFCALEGKCFTHFMARAKDSEGGRLLCTMPWPSVLGYFFLMGGILAPSQTPKIRPFCVSLEGWIVRRNGSSPHMSLVPDRVVKTMGPSSGNDCGLHEDVLCRQVAGDLGFDFDAGRFDVSVHPFTGRSQIPSTHSTSNDLHAVKLRLQFNRFAICLCSAGTA